MSKQRKGALYHQYDWTFYSMIGYMLLLDSGGRQRQGWQWRTNNGCYLLMKVDDESCLQGCVWNYTQCAKEWDALLGTRFGMWGLHFDPIELRICCKIASWQVWSRRLELDKQLAVCQVIAWSCLKRNNMWDQLKSGIFCACPSDQPKLCWSAAPRAQQLNLLSKRKGQFFFRLSPSTASSGFLEIPI